MQRHHGKLFFAIVLFGLLSVACIERVRVGPVQTRQETIAREDASEVRVEIDMGVGELTIHGGASELMNADFTYNVEDWDPEVSYEVSGATGRLDVRQPNTENIGIPDDELRYEWDLQFGDDVPLDMNVNLGAGSSNLSLAGLNVTDLELRTGAGNVDADLAGTLSNLEVETGAGEVNLDLRGAWEQDLEATIRGGVGRLTLALPSSVGVRVQVAQGVGNVTANGLSRAGNDYVNDAYGEAEVTLDLDVSGGVGEIVLEAGE